MRVKSNYFHLRVFQPSESPVDNVTEDFQNYFPKQTEKKNSMLKLFVMPRYAVQLIKSSVSGNKSDIERLNNINTIYEIQELDPTCLCSLTMGSSFCLLDIFFLFFLALVFNQARIEIVFHLQCWRTI